MAVLGTRLRRVLCRWREGGKFLYHPVFACRSNSQRPGLCKNAHELSLQVPAQLVAKIGISGRSVIRAGSFFVEVMPTEKLLTSRNRARSSGYNRTRFVRTSRWATSFLYQGRQRLESRVPTAPVAANTGKPACDPSRVQDQRAQAERSGHSSREAMRPSALA